METLSKVILQNFSDNLKESYASYLSFCGTNPSNIYVTIEYMEFLPDVNIDMNRRNLSIENWHKVCSRLQTRIWKSPILENKISIFIQVSRKFPISKIFYFTRQSAKWWSVKCRTGNKMQTNRRKLIKFPEWSPVIHTYALTKLRR